MDDAAHLARENEHLRRENDALRAIAYAVLHLVRDVAHPATAEMLASDCEADDDFASISEAAKALDISPEAVRKRRSRGTLPLATRGARQGVSLKAVRAAIDITKSNASKRTK